MKKNTNGLVFCAAMLSIALSGCASRADRGEAEVAARGKALANAQCAQCHAIGPTGQSPYPSAPIWREWVANNDIDDLARRMADGRMLHPDGTQSMPEFTFSSDEIGSLLTYMKTLRAS